MAKEMIIGLAGLGTVGSGLITMLVENREEIERRTGKTIRVKAIAVRSLSKARQLPEGCQLITDPLSLAQDPEIETIVELMGGTDIAHELISSALKAGKSVVTANKALLAHSGNELFELASQKGLSLGYEAAITGAIPIVQVLRESLAGNRIASLTGILNGTANYILSEMTTNGLDFPTALKNAQDLGFAEADPTLDIDGFDAAHKLALLVRLSWGLHYPMDKLHIEGIRNVNPMDITIAREFGYRIKLLGHAAEVPTENSTCCCGEGAQHCIEAGVYPVLVHHTLLLASVGGAYNAIRVKGNASGPLFFHGLGAGSKPTASAVLGDLLNIARGGATNNTGFTQQALPKAYLLPADEAYSPWYLRVMVRDNPGVLRDLAGCMAQQGMSVAQALQKGKQENGVPLVFMTYTNSARAMRKAIEGMEAADLLLEKAVAYRVMDNIQ